MAGRGRGRGRGQNPPQLTAVPVAVTTPATNFVGAAEPALQNPHRERQLPARFRDNGDAGEFFNTEDVSSDEGEEGDPAPTRVITPAHPSPLLTATETFLSDPLVTGGQPKTSKTHAVDVHELTMVSDGRKVCKLCKEIHELDPSHPITNYALSTTTGVIRSHFLTHPRLYLEKIIDHQWPVLSQPLKSLLHAGWSLQGLLEQLKRDPTCDIFSLGPHPNAVLPGTSVSVDNELPEFSVPEMHHLIVNFVVVDDQAIHLIECPEFRQLIRFLRPDIKESTIPHRTKLRELIMQAWIEDFNVLKGDLAKAEGKISFTSDMWSQDFSKMGYLAMTTHWIVLDDKTSLLILKAALIAFHHVPGKHIGKVLGSRMLHLLEHAEITNNLGHFMLDNAGNNHTALQELSTLLDDRGIDFDPIQQRIPCFPHIGNICVKHIVNEYTNTDFTGIADFWVVGKHTVYKDAYVKALKGDPIKKARAAVGAARASSLRRETLQIIIATGNDRGWFRDENKVVQILPTAELLPDVDTRWDSTYLMIQCFRTLRQAVDRLFVDPDHDALKKYALTAMEWHVLQDLEVILEVPRLAQQRMSGESTALLSGAVPIFQELVAGWKDSVRKAPHFAPLVKIGFTWTDEYTDRMDKTMAYAVAMFVDPIIRMSRMNEFWGIEGAQGIKNHIIGLMTQVQATGNENAMNAPNFVQSPPTELFATQTLGSRLYGIAAVDMRLPGGAQDRAQTVEQEFNAYSTARCSSRGSDKLAFWTVSKTMFPTIYAIAMDYLPVQASAVPCERVFSASSETCTKKRNRICPVMLEALQMLKFSLKKGRLNFTKGWASSQKDLIYQTRLYDADNTNLLAAVAASRADGPAVDALLNAIAEQEGDNIPGDAAVF